MVFNSFSFAVFFTFLLLLCLINQMTGLVPEKKKTTVRNILLLIASYCFYAFLKWEFVLLLLATTGINYLSSLQIENERQQGNPKRSGLWMWLAVAVSISILCYFKYAGFFMEAVNDALALLGIDTKTDLLKVAVPIGISFFTFQALTYTLDVYKGTMKASANFVDVALFVSFFPTILSGPIEKARTLLPQIQQYNRITVDDLIAASKLFLWGLFKKTVIADRLAFYVNSSYAFGNYSSLTLAVTAVFYSVQIYADFSGYSDMATAVAKAIGFRLTNNFNYPYFSTSIKEFWKKWHISLTSWFTEYVYIPLGGNRVSRSRWMLNISAVFLLSGLWHGANRTFLVWGALHAGYYLAEFFYRQSAFYKKVICPLLRFRPVKCFSAGISAGIVFLLVTVAWIFFRIDSITQAGNVLQSLFNGHGEFFWGMSFFTTLLALSALAVFFILDWIRYRNLKFSPVVTAGGYALLLSLILLFGVSGGGGFVYSQF
jgi:D-alanyl-lipoteichoic acid acyltransferase DltB (MBOAT superfamily)